MLEAMVAKFDSQVQRRKGIPQGRPPLVLARWVLKDKGVRESGCSQDLRYSSTGISLSVPMAPHGRTSAYSGLVSHDISCRSRP